MGGARRSEAHQQAAAIGVRLGGAAREMVRTLTPQEMMHGVDGFRMICRRVSSRALEPRGQLRAQGVRVCM